VRRLTRTILLMALGTCALAAQPFIFTRGVVNAASYYPYGVSAGAIAQGSIFTIFGRSIGPATGLAASSFPLGTTLANVSVSVSQGSTVVNAIPVYVSANQVNAIMPSNTPLGTVSVRVQVNGAKSNPMPARTVSYSPGIFSVLSSGAGPAVAQDFVTQTQQPVNSLFAPATPGQTVTLWATGLGPVSADNVAPAAGSLPVSIEVYVGGILAQKQYSGRSPCCAGTDQIVFQVPPNAPTGCWVPVYVRAGGLIVSNVVTMAITGDGARCTADTRSETSLIQGSRLGLLAPLRAAIRQSSPNSPVDMISDFVVARFSQEAAGQFAFNPLISLPPAGTCTAYAGAGDWFVSTAAPNIQPGIKTLNTGPFTVSGGGKSASFSLTFSPLSLGYLGSAIPVVSTMDGTMLVPGSFTIASKAGTDVGPVSTGFTMAQPPVWTNRDQISTVDRTAGLTVNWTGGTGQTIAVVGGSVDLPNNSSGIFVCVAAPGANSITVPPVLLANLPPGRRSTRYSKAIVFLAAAAASSSFNAPGLDFGVISPIYLSGKAVTIP
jgi:uncharacterized protein (TIGR03437 family)